MRSDPAEYWRSGAGLEHITPPGTVMPEGEDFLEFLAGLVGDSHVLEFGCGVGRLAGAFDPRCYIGADICVGAIARARARHPSHRFKAILSPESGYALEYADVMLCHTVLLHISDDALPAVLCSRSRYGMNEPPRVIVSEILGRSWRRAGDPPVFNREAEDYEAAFAAAGYRLADRIERPYRRYGGATLTVLVFER